MKRCYLSQNQFSKDKNDCKKYQEHYRYENKCLPKKSLFPKQSYSIKRDIKDDITNMVIY